MLIRLFIIFSCLLTGARCDQTPWEILQPYANAPTSIALDPSPWRTPFRFNDGREVTTAADWQQRREEIRSDWHQLMGKWPSLITKPEIVILESESLPSFRRDRIRFRWTPSIETEAWLLVPHGAKNAPAVLTVFYEPDTAVGINGKPHRDFALQLANKGFVCLSIGTRETTDDKTYSLYHPNIDSATVQPLSLLAYAAANSWHVLAAQPEVDASRIGITGHSYGGKWAMFASCLFDKFACAAWSDCGIAFDDNRPSINYWEPWYLGWHPRPWRKRGLVTPANPSFGLYPELRKSGRDLHELHVLMAPRPFLVSGGSEDSPERWHVLEHSKRVNQLLGHQDRVFMTNRPAHSPDAESNRVLTAFFEHFLQSPVQPKESR
jgi:hypothetical protein